MVEIQTRLMWKSLLFAFPLAMAATTASAADATPWVDFAFDGTTVPVRFANGDVQCASFDGMHCLWGASAHAFGNPGDVVVEGRGATTGVALDDSPASFGVESTSSTFPGDLIKETDLVGATPRTLKPLACGQAHERAYGSDGYSESRHWCSAAFGRLYAQWALANKTSNGTATGISIVYSVNPNGDVQCLSTNGTNCLWKQSSVSGAAVAAAAPLACGRMHLDVYRVDGYSEQQHWCQEIRALQHQRMMTVIPTLVSSPAFAAAGASLYAVDFQTNAIYVVDETDDFLLLAGEPLQTGGFRDGSIDVEDLGTERFAIFNQPRAIAAGVADDLYVADTGNNAIRRIDLTAKTVSTISQGALSRPRGVAVAPDGTVYIADTDNHLVRKISPFGVSTVLAGSGFPGDRDGQWNTASFNQPAALAVDPRGNVLVLDTRNNKVRKITPDGVVTTLAGSGKPGAANGTGIQASFRFTPPMDVDPNALASLAIDARGNVLVTDVGNREVRVISPAGDVSTLNLLVEDAETLPLGAPGGIALRPGNRIDIGDSFRIHRLSPPDLN